MAGEFDAIRETREAIWARGFRPIAIETAKQGDKLSGKRPLGAKWQINARKDPPEVIEYKTVVPYALNTGILCDGLRAIDFDIDDKDMVDRATSVATTMFGPTMLRTRNNSPRCMMVYRAAEGEPVKVAITGETHSDTVSCKIEVLGKGQQLVAYGKHWTGADLEWPTTEGGPDNRKRVTIPTVTEAQIGAFLAACVGIIGAKPIPVKPPRKKANGKDDAPTADQGDLFAALNVIPNDGPPDWEAWNKVGMALWAATEGSDAGWLMWSDWSGKHPAQDPEATLERWNNYAKSPPTETGAGKIFALAVGNSPGWRKPSTLRGNGHAQEPYPLPIPNVPPPPIPQDAPAEDEPEEEGEDDPETLNEITPPPPVTTPGEARPDKPDREIIRCVAGELPRMAREAEALLLKAGIEVYQRNSLVRPIEEDHEAATVDGIKRRTHTAALLAFTPASLMEALSEVIDFIKYSKTEKRWNSCDPPDKLIAIMLSRRGDWSFPAVRGVLTCPTIRPDGTILRDRGYDVDSRYYMAMPSDLVMPAIPDMPNKVQARAALDRLMGLLTDFPFVDEVSKAVAVCILMTQVLRCGMECSPLLAVSANAAGTGKSFLIDLASAIALGRPCPIIPPGKDENETEKGIRTKLLSSSPAFSVDNVHVGLNMPLLNMATERTHISIRMFGILEEVEVENSVVIYMTGNNLPIIDEQGRRTVRCQLDAMVENPEFRPFKVNPIDTVMADRGGYIADILTIARAYLRYREIGGERPDIPPMGDSHKAWSKLVREPLVWLGLEDAIKSQAISRDSDPVANRLEAIIEAWHAAFGIEAKTLAQASVFATTPPVFFATGQTAIDQANYDTHKANQEGLLAALRDGFAAGKDGVNTHALGNWLRRFEGRVCGGLKFIRVKEEDTKHRAGGHWRLSK